MYHEHFKPSLAVVLVSLWTMSQTRPASAQAELPSEPNVPENRLAGKRIPVDVSVRRIAVSQTPQAVLRSLSFENGKPVLELSSIRPEPGQQFVVLELALENRGPGAVDFPYRWITLRNQTGGVLVSRTHLAAEDAWAFSEAQRLEPGGNRVSWLTSVPESTLYVSVAYDEHVVRVPLAPPPRQPAPGESSKRSPPLSDSERTLWFHDGFYARFGVGLAMVISQLDIGRERSVSRNTFAPTLEIALGGAVFPGIVLGVGVYGTISPKSTVPSASEGVLVGPLVDVYPYPSKGFHLEAAGGYSSVTAFYDEPCDAAGNCVDGEGLSGPGAMAGVGYEWWFDEQWGIGALARLLYLGGDSGARSEGDPAIPTSSVALWVPSLLCTLTLN